MKRYVVKSENGWSLVNANYKRAIKNFDTQLEAIKYARKIQNTSYIMIQDKHGKFRKETGWDHSDGSSSSHVMEAQHRNVVPQYIPKYVLRNTSLEIYQKVVKFRIIFGLWFLVFILAIIAIVFGIFYGVELRRFNNV